MVRISGDASSYSTSFTVDMAASRRRGRRWPSLPAERRRPLLDEGPDALARVLGLEADVLRERLEFQRLAEIALEVVVDRALREADGHGRARDDLRGQGIRRRHEVLGGIHRADDA